MYQDYSDVWTLQEWWDISDACEYVMKGAVRESWTKDEVDKLHNRREL